MESKKGILRVKTICVFYKLVDKMPYSFLKNMPF